MHSSRLLRSAFSNKISVLKDLISFISHCNLKCILVAVCIFVSCCLLFLYLHLLLVLLRDLKMPVISYASTFPAQCLRSDITYAFCMRNKYIFSLVVMQRNTWNRMIEICENELIYCNSSTVGFLFVMEHHRFLENSFIRFPIL